MRCSPRTATRVTRSRLTLDRAARCLHNLNYWQFGDYLGLGAGAHGKVTLRSAGEIARRAKTRNPRTYQQRAGAADSVAQERVATPKQAALEFLMNALRLVDGTSEEIFVARAGQPVVDSGCGARRRSRTRLAHERAASVLRATPSGIDRLNRLLELFA